MGGKTSKFGSIAITLDDPYFVAGGYVNGKVHLDCKQAFYATQILLIIDAKQWASVQDKKVPLEVFNTIYGSYMVLHRLNERYVQKGQYTFPFSFMLESYLPGTFNMDLNKKDHAHIKYFLRTEIVSQTKDVDLKYSTELIVREVNRNGTRPSSVEDQIPTNKACCSSKGFGVLSAYLDKNAYLAGQTALLTCSIDNMKSSSVFKVKAQLIQTLSVIGQNNNPVTFRNVISQEELPVFGKKQVSTFTINVPLNAKKSKELLQPSTNGRVINCRYHIEILPKYSTFFSSVAVGSSILPLVIQAIGGITEIQAPQNWKPTTFDSKLLLIGGRESFQRREGSNPYEGTLERKEETNPYEGKFEKMERKEYINNPYEGILDQDQPFK